MELNKIEDRFDSVVMDVLKDRDLLNNKKKEIKDKKDEISSLEDLGSVATGEVSRKKNELARLENEKKKMCNNTKSKLLSEKKFIKEEKTAIQKGIERYTKKLNLRENTILKLKAEKIRLRKSGDKSYVAKDAEIKNVIKEKIDIAKKRNEMFKEYASINPHLIDIYAKLDKHIEILDNELGIEHKKDTLENKEHKESKGKTDDEKTDDGKTDDEKTDDGKTDDGRTDDGRTDDGRTDDGKSDDGRTDDGKSDDGRTDDGKSDDGSTDDGKTDDGKSDDGKTDDGKSDDGKSDDGRTDDGKSDDGKSDDGRTDDGRTDDGRTDDGKSDDGKPPRIVISANKQKAQLLYNGKKYPEKPMDISNMSEIKKDLYKRLGIKGRIRDGMDQLTAIGIRHLDPTIIQLISLIENEGSRNEIMDKYIEATINKDRDVMPLDVTYDLRDSKLPDSEFNKLQKHAKRQFFAGNAKVEGLENLKPSLFDKIFNRQSIKKLEAAKTENVKGVYEGKIEQVDKTFNEKGMDAKESELGKALFHYLDKSYENAKGKNSKVKQSGENNLEVFDIIKTTNSYIEHLENQISAKQNSLERAKNDAEKGKIQKELNEISDKYMGIVSDVIKLDYIDKVQPSKMLNRMIKQQLYANQKQEKYTTKNHVELPQKDHPTSPRAKFSSSIEATDSIKAKLDNISRQYKEENNTYKPKSDIEQKLAQSYEQKYNTSDEDKDFRKSNIRGEDEEGPEIE